MIKNGDSSASSYLVTVNKYGNQNNLTVRTPTFIILQ